MELVLIERGGIPIGIEKRQSVQSAQSWHKSKTCRTCPILCEVVNQRLPTSEPVVAIIEPLNKTGLIQNSFTIYACFLEGMDEVIQL